MFPHALFPASLFPGVMFPPVAGVVPTVPPTLLSAVRELLSGTSGLSSLTGVFNSIPPANQATPFIVLSAIGETPVWNNSGTSYFAWSDIQVTIVTEDDVQGITLRNSVLNILNPKASTGGLVFGDGSTDKCLPGRNWQMHQGDTGPAGQIVWLTGIMARFLVTRTT